MFKWLGQQFGKSKLKTGQLQQRELNDDLVVGDGAPQQTISDPLLKRAAADAEQIVTSIKTRALVEAEAEATRIISQTKLDVQEIIARAEIDAQKQTEDILSAANKKAEIIEVEAKQRALQLLIRVGEEVEKEVGEEAKRKVEETKEAKEAQKRAEKEARLPVQIQEQAVKENGKEPTPLELDSQALYAGEVELFIAASVEMKVLSKFYDYLQTVPELKILYTRGSSEQGSTIAVVLDKPLPLIGILSQTPGVKVTPLSLGKDDLAVGKSNLLPGREKEGVKRIKLDLKKA